MCHSEAITDGLNSANNYVGRNVFLYCSAGKKTIVSELLKIAESSAPLEIGSSRETCLRGGEGGRGKDT